jgi:hypothetical protein
VSIDGSQPADPAWVDLSQQIAGALYTAVERGRRLTPPSTRDAEAQHHMIIATAAIAGAEMEALSALCALGLHTPAQIHARAIGLLARNAIVFHEDAVLARECCDSLETSRRELSQIAQTLLDNADLDALLEKRYADAAGKSMQKLEQTHATLFHRQEHYLMSAYEQRLWSKWAHGDIIALADAAESVRLANQDIRAAIAVKPELALNLMFRTGLSASVLLALLADRRCVPVSTVTSLIEQHRSLTAQITAFAKFREAFEQSLREETPKRDSGVSD